MQADCNAWSASLSQSARAVAAPGAGHDSQGAVAAARLDTTVCQHCIKVQETTQCRCHQDAACSHVCVDCSAACPLQRLICSFLLAVAYSEHNSNHACAVPKPDCIDNMLIYAGFAHAIQQLC